MKTVQKILLNHYKLLLCLLIVLVNTATAQPPTQGMSPLAPGNLNPAMMTKSGFETFFKDNNQKQNTPGGDRTKDNPEIRKRLENKKLDKDSTQGDNLKRAYYRADDTYGANIFQNSAMNDISELSIPPHDYPIGVGDHIIVSLWGGGEYQEDYIVARDGAIFPSGLGKITVQGLTFENAQQIITARFNTAVPPGTNIQITLGQPRTININVVGEVMNPGPKLLSAFSNAYNAIGLAGGVSAAIEFADRVEGVLAVTGLDPHQHPMLQVGRLFDRAVERHQQHLGPRIAGSKNHPIHL